MECHLECDPGFVPNIAAAVSCVGGKYVPNKPSTFSCNPAAAIIITSGGEVETFSGEQKCNSVITNIPPHFSTRQSVNVFGNHLVIAGYSVWDGTWNYISLEDPRSSLLSNQWTVSTSVQKHAPQSHVSFTYGRSLILVGGSQEAAMRLDTETIGGNWDTFSLPWANGTNFTSFTSSGCGIKVSKHEFLMIGGINIKSNKVTSTIVKIDMKNKVVKELPGLRVSRAFHSCEVIFHDIDQRTILVTGGRTSASDDIGSIAPDEQYNVDREISSYSNKSMVVPRFNHRLVLLGDTIFALGGRMANQSETQLVERYDTKTASWEVLNDGLLSHSTGDLAVATIAKSSLDCSIGCSCGISREATSNGGAGCEAKVTDISLFEDCVNQAGIVPWIGLILEDSSDPLDSRCAFSLVFVLYHFIAVF